jgi:hypothetical protein
MIVVLRYFTSFGSSILQSKTLSLLEMRTRLKCFVVTVDLGLVKQAVNI